VVGLSRPAQFRQFQANVSWCLGSAFTKILRSWCFAEYRGFKMKSLFDAAI